MIKNLNKIHAWAGLSIISPACNLKCHYCNIEKARKTSSCAEDNIFFKKTIEALENGEYLENLKKAFKRYQRSTDEVIQFDIWGQEPTLIMGVLAKHWKEWYETFPNIKKVSFSTNGIGFTEDLANYLFEISNYATEEIVISLQYSYDGPIGENVGRGYEGEHSIVIKNLLNLIDLLNKHNLKNLKVELNLHAVLSVELLEKLQTFSAIDNYYKIYSEQLELIENAITHKRIEFRGADLLAQTCGNFTVSHAYQMSNFIRMSDRIRDTKDYKFFGDKNFSPHSLVNSIFGTFLSAVVELIISNHFYNLDDFINNVFENKNLINFSGAMCGTLISNLRMAYDGTTYDCHGSIFDPFIIEDKLSNEIFDQVRLQCYKHNWYGNLLTMSDKEAEDLIDFYSNTLDGYSITCFMWSNIMTQMYILALANQIDQSYLFDYQKLQKHSFLIAKANQCFSNLKLMNGSIFVRGSEEIKSTCNSGLIDLIEKAVNHDLKIREGRNECEC